MSSGSLLVAADQIGGEASAPLLEDLDDLGSGPDRRAHRLPGGPPGREQPGQVGPEHHG